MLRFRMPLLCCLILSACSGPAEGVVVSQALVEAVERARAGERGAVEDDLALRVGFDDAAVYQAFCDRLVSKRAFVRPVEFQSILHLGGNLYAAAKSGFIGDEHGVALERNNDDEPFVQDHPTLHFYQFLSDETYKVDTRLPTLAGFGCPATRGFNVWTIPAGRVVVEALRAQGEPSQIMVSSQQTWRPIEELLDEALGLNPSLRAAWIVRADADAFSLVESDCCGLPPAVYGNKRAEVVIGAEHLDILDIVLHDR